METKEIAYILLTAMPFIAVGWFVWGLVKIDTLQARQERLRDPSRQNSPEHRESMAYLDKKIRDSHRRIAEFEFERIDSSFRKQRRLDEMASDLVRGD